MTFSEDLSGYSVVNSLDIGKNGSRESFGRLLEYFRPEMLVVWTVMAGERERSRWTEIFLHFLVNVI